ncbi:MAG: efflux RND transporter periplasmic adaptor subunit [Verrucomicrobiota bacterium]
MRWPTPLTALSGLLAGALLIALLPEHTLFTSRSAHADTASASASASATPTGPGTRYACPMMDFIGNQPGNCPVCGMKMTPVTTGELTREQQSRMGVELTRIATGPARATIRAYGAVRYDDRTLQVVIPRVAGRIVKRHPAVLHAGTVVKAGDPLVDLYSPDVFATQGELAAAMSLGDQHSVTALTQRLERWNLAPLARAILGGRPPVDTVTLTSPYAGQVILSADASAAMDATRLPQLGQEVMADTPLLRLVDPRTFMLVVHVPEPRAHWLRLDQPVQLSSDDRGELADISARIAWIAPELNAEIRAREIHIHLTDPAQRLLAGSLVNARIEATLGPDLEVAAPDAPPATFTLVPKSAVLSTGVRHVAWRLAQRLDDGRARFELAPLALGPRLEDANGNDHYIVRSGLKPGDEVATQGLFLIDAQAQLAGTPSLLFPAGATP